MELGCRRRLKEDKEILDNKEEIPEFVKEVEPPENSKKEDEIEISKEDMDDLIFGK